MLCAADRVRTERRVLLARVQSARGIVERVRGESGRQEGSARESARERTRSLALRCSHEHRAAAARLRGLAPSADADGLPAQRPLRLPPAISFRPSSPSSLRPSTPSPLPPRWTPRPHSAVLCARRRAGSALPARRTRRAQRHQVGECAHRPGQTCCKTLRFWDGAEDA